MSLTILVRASSLVGKVRVTLKDYANDLTMLDQDWDRHDAGFKVLNLQASLREERQWIATIEDTTGIV